MFCCCCVGHCNPVGSSRDCLSTWRVLLHIAEAILLGVLRNKSEWFVGAGSVCRD